MMWAARGGVLYLQILNDRRLGKLRKISLLKAKILYNFRHVDF